jgi:putative SOS response-associated peptidase YedK
MPSILLPEHEDRWLSKGPLNAADLKDILAPFPAGNMSMYPVSPLVNSPDVDNESIIKPMNALKLTEDTNA